eukprot:COSAG02_NODE_60480_length_271_cov_0.604651_1_plen_49_part_10
MASLSLGGEWEAQRRANHANWEDRVDSHVGETSRYSKELAAVRARQPAL